MDDFARLNHERWSLFPRALVSGFAAGVVAVAFRVALNVVEAGHEAALDWAGANGVLGLIGAVAGTLAAVGVGLVLVRRLAPEATGSGIPHFKLVLEGKRPFRAVRVLAVKFAGGVLAIGGGLGLGREGPTIQMGAAVADRVAAWWPGRRGQDRESLLICGAAAGLTAAFNAPLAGVVFALEELQIRFSHTAFFATAVAALTADVASRALLGELPVFTIKHHTAPTLPDLPYVAAGAAVVSLVGVVFTRLIVAGGDFARAGGRPLAAGYLIVAGGVGLLGWWHPAAIGGGLGLTDGLLDGRLSLGAVAVYAVVRFTLTVGSYALGAAGGIFAPMLLIGGLCGAALGMIATDLGLPHAPDPIVWAVAGMAAMFGAVVRCPLTGIVLLVEMTGDYRLILPLLCAAFVGSGVGDAFGVRPVYEWLKERAEAAEPAKP